jgi:hypothetical protein
MRISTAVIATLWAFALFSNLWATFPSGHAGHCLPQTGSPPPFLLLVPILVFGGWALIAPPQSPFYNPRLANLVDAKAGPGAFEAFLVRLKPMLLFGISAAIGGGLGAWNCLQLDQLTIGTEALFYLSAGFAFVLAHSILRYRKARGV